jgi:hypothetical protein
MSYKLLVIRFSVFFEELNYKSNYLKIEKMKCLFAIMLGLASFSIYGQDVTTGFDGPNWKAPYDLPVPKDWAIERFPVPISFAPQIPYTGVEDIRFAPGWGKVKSEEYWTYAFLWYLDGAPKMDAEIIAGNLKVYYSGLIKSNSDSTWFASGSIQPVTALFKKTATTEGDQETYAGSIEMADYMQRKPIMLNCIVHLKACPEFNKTIIFHEISPKPKTHANWISLNQLWTGFKCKNDTPLK